MPKKPVIFLGNTYKTQGEFEAYIKDIIYNDVGICDNIKINHPSHYIKLIEILKRHPDFDNKTQDMCDLSIVRDALNVHALKIMIINEDASETDISWRCAITGKPKTKKEELVSAMRSSVDEQIFQFRKDNEKQCVLCLNTDKTLEVDHIIHFDEIVFNFMKRIENKKISIPNSLGDTIDNTHRRCFLETDVIFKNEWIDYHRKNAQLRMLCKKCNATRHKSELKLTNKMLNNT